MILDNQTLIFNLDKTFNLFNLSAKQFDTNSARSFTFQFIQNNTPFSLNGINVKVGGVKPDGKKIFNDVQIIDSTNGIVELDLTSQMLAVNGVLKLEFIFMKDNIRLSSYPFEINIVPSVTNFNAIISSDEFNTLTNTLNSVDGTINNLTNKVNETIEKTNVQEIAKEVLGVTLSYINPTFSDCNDFKEPNKYFTWDTGQGAFNNTPLGNLSQGSGIVFEVINYGVEGKVQQEFIQTYPLNSVKKWIRNYANYKDGVWSDWQYTGSVQDSINTNTKQIASNSSSINDLYSWVNRNIQMEYISGATSLTLQANKAYYLDQQHVADITSIDHSALQNGEKVYFYVASGDPLAHIVFRRSGLCNQDCKVWLPKGQDFWITGNDNGDTIFTLMKIGDAMRFLS